MNRKPDLTALTGSRICHDLISPVGAIGNGVELLLADAGELVGPELALIADSAAHANVRIRFFRIAFGGISGGHRVAPGEVRQILQDLSRGSRLSFLWRADGDLARDDIRLVFLLLLCLESAMPRGGQITVDLSGGRWQLEAHSPHMAADPALFDMLSGGTTPADLAPEHVQFALAGHALAERGTPPGVQQDASGLTLSFASAPRAPVISPDG